MEKIKPKKERKFLKAIGDIALTLLREIVLGIGKKVINKVGNKRQGLVIAFALVAGISYASIDSIPYPITFNKQRLGFQTTGNGLVYRGRSADTITKPSSYVDKNVKAYLLVDSVLGTIFVWRQTYWDSIKVNTRLMPFDSITFNTAKDGTVGVGEVEYNDTQGSLIQGLKGGNVTNVIGQQLHQRVNNRTGAPLAKGDVVYLSGSQGNRITVAKAIATSDPTSANTFGIVAESIADNASGYVITEGLITGLNTSALTQDSAVYLSGTTAGALTSIKPQAPIHGVYIGVCVKSNSGSGELFVKIRNGQELDELHDVQITSPVNNSSLYYKSSDGLWRDTTAALLVSDTASMLTNYLRTGLADSTYLKLTGGTLTGGLSGTSINLSSTINSTGDIFFGSNSSYSGLKTRYFKTFDVSPNRDLYIGSVGTIGTWAGRMHFQTSYNTETPTTAMTINEFGNINMNGTLGVTSNITANSFIKSGGTSSQFLKADGSVDNNTYLTTSSASSTYLPLTGGTLTGGLNGTTGTFTGLNVNNTNVNGEGILTLKSYNFNFANKIQFGDGAVIRREIIYPNSSSNMQFRSYPTGTAQGGYEFYVSNGSSESLAATIGTDKSLSLTGTLGVTGATTLSAPLTVNSSAVFNEGSADADFRVESDGNANMVFVDASTDRVGIGTNAPTKTLDVNGEVKIATTTATPTSLLGKDGSNVVGNVRVITPLTLAGDSINLNTVPISKGGTGSTSESGARSNLGVGYVFYASTAGDAIQLSSNKVFIVNSGGASTTTITLGTATAGRLYIIKNLATGTVISDSSNVIPLNGGSAGTAILSAGNLTTQWCTLVCDGTNWHIMQSN